MDRKTELLDYAEDLIQRVGVNAMSYSDLSKGIGIQKPSIHHHFPKKEDLVLELQKRCRIKYSESYRAIAQSKDFPADKLLQLADIFCGSVKEGKLCLVTMLGAENESLNDESKVQLQGAVDSTVMIFESIFQEGVDSGEFTNCEDPEAAAYAFLSLLMGGHLMARCSGGEEKLKSAAKEFVHHLTK